MTQQPEQIPNASEENVMAALASVPSGETSNEAPSEATTDQVPSVEEPVVTTKKSDGSSTVSNYFFRFVVKCIVMILDKRSSDLDELGYQFGFAEETTSQPCFPS